MYKRILIALLGVAMLLGLLCGCGGENPGSSASASAAASDPAAKVATAADMTEVVDVVEEGMVPVYPDALQDGTYPVEVDCSSSMFKIASCQLQVQAGTMTATLTMGGSGYLFVYPGSALEAAAAPETDYIAFVEDAEGNQTYTIPVEALDAGIPLAAFSRKKELWYDRTLVFRADSLPAEAFRESRRTTLEDLALADGEYTVEVSLDGGSGKASVASPARLHVEGGACTAELIWSSSNYDYMMVDGEKYLPTTLEGGSTFEIPVLYFDDKMPVSADTTAMSQPYEIEYTLVFHAETIQAVS